ncbi:hypothetical protein Sango_1802200 [Sesamum angolense]|uniref:Sulfotransferase n=1 Tax=Sesamum angolense TaxID=2727404 RepID=A0AAE1WHD8_9LAMI|nr:hypothetical protein Sango_1802200 [Sesamum angolense]
MHSRPAPWNQVGMESVAACLPLGTRKAVYFSGSCNLFIEGLIIKPPKKSPASLRILVLVFAMVCGVYICSFCLNQTNVHPSSKFLNLEVNWRNCHDHSIDRSQIPYLHYPKPTTFSRAECACNPVRPFAILSMQRSGSGWFETLLNHHTNVSSNGEIFSMKQRRSNVSSILSTLDRVYNLDWVSSASKNQCSSAVGFKWMLNQSTSMIGVSVIFLFRRNLLRRMVSVIANSHDRYAKLLNGTHKSHVHSHEEADKLSSYKPIINSTSLVMDLKQMEKMVLEALEHFSSTRHIILYYEDLIKNRTKLVDVQEFLGLPLNGVKKPTDQDTQRIVVRAHQELGRR